MRLKTKWNYLIVFIHYFLTLSLIKLPIFPTWRSLLDNYGISQTKKKLARGSILFWSLNKRKLSIEYQGGNHLAIFGILFVYFYFNWWSDVRLLNPKLRSQHIYLSFSLFIIVSLLYLRTGTSNNSCKTLAPSIFKLPVLIRDLIAPVTLH